MLYTTLNKIKENSPCIRGWNTLLKHLNKTKADDEPLSFLTILESNGLADTLWCCRAAPEYDKEWRLFAVWCGRQVQHLMLDKRNITADAAAYAAAAAVYAGADDADAAYAARAAAYASDAAAYAAAARAAAYAAAARAAARARAAAGVAQKEQFILIIS